MNAKNKKKPSVNSLKVPKNNVQQLKRNTGVVNQCKIGLQQSIGGGYVQQNVNKSNALKQTKVQTGGNDKIITTNTMLLDTKKLERSNSFYLTRKLSKIFNSITGSRENLTKYVDDKRNDVVTKDVNNIITDDDIDNRLPYKFTRSRSMISLRKSNRRSVLEPQLEELSEEIEKSPIEMETLQPNHNYHPPLKNSKTLPTQSNNLQHQQKKPSTLIATLKRTFSSHSDKRKQSNPRWSASLISLQEIDNMVSYEDLSFIDYDKFNNYERVLEKQLSQQDLSVTLPVTPTSIDSPQQQQIVVRRRKRNTLQNYDRGSHDLDFCRPRSSIFIADWDHNFDKPKNLYRQSLDDQKLQHLNDLQRNSFRWSQKFEPLLTESLLLDNYQRKYVESVNNNNNKSKSFENLRGELPKVFCYDVVDSPTRVTIHC